MSRMSKPRRIPGNHRNWYTALPEEKKKERSQYQVQWRIEAKKKRLAMTAEEQLKVTADRQLRREIKAASKLPVNYEESREGYCSICGIFRHGNPGPCEDHALNRKKK